MSFVHLHTHSEYSLLEANCRVKALAKKTAEYGMPAVALTDYGNMFGAIEFYFACKDNGVKPLLGMEAYFAPESRLIKKADRDAVQSGPRRMVLLAMNQNGYRNLCQLSTIGYQEGFYYKPRIDDEVLKMYHQDLILLSGHQKGMIIDTFQKEGAEAALAKIKAYKNIFEDRFYLEFVRTGIPQQKEYNQFLIEASKITSVPLIATNDVHYLNPEDQVSQEVLICIGSNRALADESRFKLGSDQFYFKKPAEMQKTFSDFPEAVARTLEVADRCSVQFKLKDEKGKPIYHLPTFPTPSGVSIEQDIRQKSYDGLELRFSEIRARGEELTPADEEIYKKRLEFELEVITRMGFNGYFLIVQDFINWAKNNNIPVGPGRGSGAGSLVAFSLRITDLDPIPWKLLFERFLNPERISMPDFDIDFCQDRRQEVIHYVTQKYGAKSVSQIITYGKLMAKAAIKDVSRVLGLSFAEADAISKMIPEKPGTTINDALEVEPRLKEMMETNPQVSTVIDLAQRIEGMARNAGIHAAGVIIADGDLTQHAPLYKGADGENVVQYDMKHAEKIGLIKFDFLGLKTLTHIQRALDLIEKNRHKKIGTHEISLKDPGIYEIMAKGDTLGIFQFEGEGITQAIRQIKPTSFADITAINALYRPGPMAMIPEFAKRKHGEVPIEFPFKELQEILSETYGIIVYQEQVMGIASIVAGYSLGEADMLRRAMGKKIKEEMDQQRIRFLEGAKAKGFDAKKSEEVFELMYKFADYGFNKSHAAAYCVVAAQTAWLKNYYPVEFYAALLSTEISNTDNVVKYIKDAKKHQIEICPPHINSSEFLFTCEDRKIYFGLGAIKGVGEGAVQAIVEARMTQPQQKFASLDDFFNSVDIKALNKKVIECLIKAGALDGFGYHRAQLMAGYQTFLDRANETHKDREIGQASLFDLEPSSFQKVIIPETKKWTRHAQLSIEKEVLGFYLSDHPLSGYQNIFSTWTTGPLADLKSLLPDKEGAKMRVVVSGLIAEMKEHITKKGTRMAFAKLEDLSSSCEVIFFPDVYAKYEQVCRSEKPVLLGGMLENDEGALKIMVDTASSAEDVYKKAKRIIFHIQDLQMEDYSKLDSLVKEHPGQTQYSFEITLSEYGRKVQLDPEGKNGVALNDEFFESLQSHFGGTDFIEIRN